MQTRTSFASDLNLIDIAGPGFSRILTSEITEGGQLSFLAFALGV